MDVPGRRTDAARAQPVALAAIAVGSVIGALARYGVAAVVHVGKDQFPWATFWTNVSGSFVLGLLLGLILERLPPTHYARAFAATGLLGAYTTYSTFAVETDLLVSHGHILRGLAYGALSVVAGVLATFSGLRAGRAGGMHRGSS